MNNKIKELENQLTKAATEKEKVDALNALASELTATDFQRAVAKGEEAAKLAQKIDAKQELAESHKLLAVLYENQGHSEDALFNFKQFHVLNEELFNAQNAKRLQLLKVQHQVDMAQRDADSFAQKNIKLENEILEREQIQANLQKHEEELQILIEFSPNAVGIVNTKTGLFESINVGAERLYGLTREELLNVGPAHVSPELQPDGRPSGEKAMEKIKEALDGGRPIFEWTHTNANGDEIPCEVNLVGLPGARSHLVRFSVTDITDRKYTEAQLARLGAVVEQSLDGTAVVNLEGMIQFVNPAWANMHGYTVKEVLGQSFAIFYTEEQLHNEAIPFQRKAKENGRNQGEVGHKHKDGSTFLTWMSAILLTNDAGDPVSFVASAQDITKRKQAETTISKRAAELQTVAEMSTAVSKTLDTQQLMQDVVDLTKERFNLYHVHIYLLNSQDKVLILTSGAGDIGQRMVGENHHILLSKEQSLIAQAARSKQGVIENDVLNNPAFLPHSLLPDTRAEMAVPMLVGNRVIGVLDVQSNEAGHFTQQDINVQSTLAAQVGVALENARSFESTQRALSETEVLLNITRETAGSFDLKKTLTNVLDEILEAIGFDAGLFTVIDHKMDSLKLLAERLPSSLLGGIQENGFDNSLCDMVFRSGKNLIIQDMKEESEIDLSGLISLGFKSYIGIPLIARGEVLGTLCLFNKNHLDATNRNNNLLKAIGQQVGTAVQTMILFEQSNLQSQRLTKLNEMGNALNGASSVDEIYQIVSQYTQAILKSERASLAIVNDDQKTVSVLGLSGLEGAIPLGIELPIEGTALGRAILKQQLVCYPQDAPLEKFPDTHKLQESGVQATISAPLNVRKKIIGTINLASNKQYQYGEPEKVILQQITSLVSSAIETRIFVERIEKQAADLKTVAEVSTTVATALDTQQLMQDVVDLTKERFNLYHAHIYLLNPQGNTLILTSGAGNIGQSMVAEKRHILLSTEQSLVAQAARNKQGVIENDVLNNAAFLPHPLLPDTRAEMAVPMLVGDRVIGVLDVQSDHANRFLQQDVDIQTTLAAQIAVALENARSFEEANEAVANLNELTQRLTHEGWQGYVDQLPTEKTRFVYDASQSHLAQPSSIQHGIEMNGTGATINDENISETEQLITQAISIHGKAIGQLAVIPDDDEVDVEIEEILTAVAANLTAHIENLRLSEQTQTALVGTEEQARRLAQLNEMSAALNQAETLSDIYRLAVEEPRRILSVDRVSLPLLNDKEDMFEVVAFSGEESEMPVGMQLPIKDAPMTEAIQKNQIVKGYADGLESVLFAPIIVGDRAIGTINIGKKQEGAFDLNDENLLQQITSLVGSSIENMSLLKNEQERAQREQVLREITERVRGSIDVETIMKTAVSEIGRALGRPVIVSLNKQSTREV